MIVDAERSRPWSPDEIAEMIPELKRRIDDAIIELKHLGKLASAAKWRFEHHKAKAMLVVCATQEGRSNAELRKAQAMLEHVDVKDHDPNTGQPIVRKGVPITTLGFESDLAERAYADMRTQIFAMENDRKILQSLLVSARESTPS